MPDSQKVGPHPSYVELRRQFITEETIQDFFSNARITEAKEDSMRLQGVAWIDNVRKALKLWDLPFDVYNRGSAAKILSIVP